MHIAICKLRTVILVAVATLLLPGGALAHSFNVAMLVPDGASAEAVQAFLLASDENDRHAGAESDGHLGGLDSYINVFEVGENRADLLDAIVASQPDIIAIAGAGLRDRGLEEMFGAADAWVLPLYVASARASEEFLAGGSLSFVIRYIDQNGVPPGEVAQLSYFAARLIDIAVRAQGGAGDRAALAAAIEGY